MMAKNLATDPWRLLWLTPYTQLLQFQHVSLRANDAWTVTPEAPAEKVSADEFDALLNPRPTADGDTAAEV